MEGWCPVEGNGLARCVRTREVGMRMIQAAHEAIIEIAPDRGPRPWVRELLASLVVSTDNEMTA